MCVCVRVCVYVCVCVCVCVCLLCSMKRKCVHAIYMKEIEIESLRVRVQILDVCARVCVLCVSYFVYQFQLVL